jgi:hypothetical protein
MEEDYKDEGSTEEDIKERATNPREKFWIV